MPFFLLIFAGETCPQAPEPNNKVYVNEALLIVDDHSWGVVKPVAQSCVSGTRWCASRDAG